MMMGAAPSASPQSSAGDTNPNANRGVSAGDTAVLADLELRSFNIRFSNVSLRSTTLPSERLEKPTPLAGNRWLWLGNEFSRQLHQRPPKSHGQFTSRQGDADKSTHCCNL